jgi:hypothetical protein
MGKTETITHRLGRKKMSLPGREWTIRVYPFNIFKVSLPGLAGIATRKLTGQHFRNPDLKQDLQRIKANPPTGKP